MFFLLNVWRPIVHVLFYWPHPGLCRYVCMDGLYKRSKFLFNRMKNTWVIKGQNFRHSLSTSGCLLEPNLTFIDRDETGARRTVWTNDSLGSSAQKFLSPLFRVMAPERWYLLISNNLLTHGLNFLTNCVLCTMVLVQCLVSVSTRSVKVTFCIFWSLCSADETYLLISNPYSWIRIFWQIAFYVLYIAKIVPIGNPRWPPSWKSIRIFSWIKRPIVLKLDRKDWGD